eukprot:gene22662-25671_t
MDLVGTDRNTFINDAAAQQAVIDSFAAGMNGTSEDQVFIANITDTSGRHLSHLYLRSGLQTSAAGIAITLEVRRILEKLGLTSSDGAALHASMAAQVTTAVSSGDFTTRLASRLTALGSPMTLTPQTETFNVGDYSLRVVETPAPSLQPVESPQQPTSNAGFSPASRPGLSVGAVFGITVAVLLVALFILMCFYYKHRRKTNATVHVVANPFVEMEEQFTLVY